VLKKSKALEMLKTPDDAETAYYDASSALTYEEALLNAGGFGKLEYISN
jgi:hypothetical protein